LISAAALPTTLLREIKALLHTTGFKGKVMGGAQEGERQEK